MSHYAVVAPPFYSHFRALQALAQQLLALGHQVTFIHQADAAALLTDARIGFYPVGSVSHPPGSLKRTLWLTAHPTGTGILRLIDELASTSRMLCRELPQALEAIGAEGLLVDQMEAAGGIVAEALGLPFVSVACALPVNREPALPLPVMPFRYADTQRLYHASEKVYDWLMQRHGAILARESQRLGLAPRYALHECLSPLAQISQIISALDFPRQRLPACFHAVGPLRAAVQPLAAACASGDASRPQIFASLGTLQGHRYRLFAKIARACQRLDLPLLIAHCGGLNAAQVAKLQACGATQVTSFADQAAVLQQAQAVITHGGLNTVIDAVESATPLLTMPLAFDQPGVAARVVWSGIGRRVSRFASSRTIAASLQRLLDDDSYRQRLTAIAAQLKQAGGAPRAAQVAQQALQQHRPVLASVER